MLQRTELHLQKSESSALTFTSNHACGGLQLQVPIIENPVSYSKMSVTTGLEYCLLSSRSCVRITQGALITAKGFSESWAFFIPKPILSAFIPPL